MIGAKNKKGYEKTESRMLISQHTSAVRCRLRASQGQDKARVKESRYVIKVMSVNMEGGTFLWSARTKGCTGPFNWAIIN